MTKTISKFCSKCGTELSKTAKFCTNCGKAVQKESKKITQDPSMDKPNKRVAVQEQSTMTNPKEQKSNNLVGVSGFLTLFILSLIGTIFIFTIDVFQTLPIIDNENSIYILPIVVIEVSIVIIAASILLKISSHKKTVVKLIKILIYLGMALGVIMYILALLIKSSAGEIDRNATDALMNGGIRNLIVSAIWLIYFNTSKRVKNTFTK